MRVDSYGVNAAEVVSVVKRCNKLHGVLSVCGYPEKPYLIQSLKQALSPSARATRIASSIA